MKTPGVGPHGAAASRAAAASLGSLALAAILAGAPTPQSAVFASVAAPPALEVPASSSAAVLKSAEVRRAPRAGRCGRVLCGTRPPPP